MRRKSPFSRSIRPIASWPGLGEQFRMISRRHWYHSHTVFGSAANASGVARDIGSRFLHIPPGPRKVGTPLSAETPAPVRTHIDLHSFTAILASFRSETIAFRLPFPRTPPLNPFPRRPALRTNIPPADVLHYRRQKTREMEMRAG